MTLPNEPVHATRTLIDALLEDQRDLTAAQRFARGHAVSGKAPGAAHTLLIPLSAPKPGEQYAFEVDLDRCSSCKACVTACHALNGLDDDETWRSVGLLHGRGRGSFQQTITTACHHCVDPACLNGCPVLAYDKDPLTGIVRHLDDQCIGCEYCVLMCPYEVPKYSERRGIVRKCDMCHQRLANHESPACVQACPSEAIHITVVEKDDVLRTYGRDASTSNSSGQHSQLDIRTNPFLPGSPDPAITLPTTRYISSKPLPPDLIAGDANELKLHPPHWPLIWMLVLTHLGAGGFLMLPLSAPTAQPALAGVALTATLFGLAGSLLHLGQPQKAWRAFLGLRRSWLSREIIVFGMFALLAAASTIVAFASSSRSWAPALFCSTSFTGLLGVFCSGMTYHATQRECWHGELSVGRFFGAALVLGSGLALCTGCVAGMGTRTFALVLPLVTLFRLSRDFAFLRLCPDDADLGDELPSSLLARRAFLMRFPLGRWLRFRFACTWLGGVVMPLVVWVSPITSALPITGFSLLLAGEFIERFLFFRAVAVARMPGGVAT